jgi:hypothetical protein
MSDIRDKVDEWRRLKKAHDAFPSLYPRLRSSQEQYLKMTSANGKIHANRKRPDQLTRYEIEVVGKKIYLDNRKALEELDAVLKKLATEEPRVSDDFSQLFDMQEARDELGLRNLEDVFRAVDAKLSALPWEEQRAVLQEYDFMIETES